MPRLTVLPCLDSDALASANRSQLHLPRERAAWLGRTAVAAIREGRYRTERGRTVELRPLIDAALSARVSLPPEAPLPASPRVPFPEAVVQVTNETTRGAGRRLVERGGRVVALNFANGVHPGGGFLTGARAQEEVLCRSSALYATLEGDAMYAAHWRRDDRESSAWAILSPDVPFFRADDGTALEEPWRLSIVTCAAPVADAVGQPRSAELLARRIHRVLAIAAAWGYDALVLGAWGCGAFGNDPVRAAGDFRAALEGPFLGSFREVVFAITDWSPERRTLGPFREAFGSAS